MTSDLRQPTPFAYLLKRHRLAAGLSHEALAERAGLSVRGISDIERGLRRAPRRETVALLARALNLSDDETAELRAAVRSARGALNGTEAPTSPVQSHVSTNRMAGMSLPVPLTMLLGRERELDDLEGLLTEPETRMVTLTGPAGVGKTRLAIQAASDAASAFPGGCVFVDLAPVANPGLALSAIAETLAVGETGSQSLLESLAAASTARRLLVLDNFEQIVAAGPRIVELLAACPPLVALVTSRAALRVRGEHEYLLHPLAVPHVTESQAAADATTFASVRLLVERARAANPSFVVTDATAPTIAAICRRLDGLPLALELAAARLKLLSPHTLLARLEQSLRILVGGAADLPARQQTLRDTLAWSYNLLATSEQRLFRALGVFAGGCTVEAVEAVCGDAEMDEAKLSILDGVASLLDKSLLIAEPERAEDDGEPRLRMLETVREYSAELLAGLGEEDLLRERHADYYAAIAEHAERALRGPEQDAWYGRLDAEHDNFRAALRWLFAHDYAERAAQICVALYRFWGVRGYLTEGRMWLDRALARADGLPRSLRADLFLAAGRLAHNQSDYERAQAFLEASVTLYPSDEPSRTAGLALSTLGEVMRLHGRDVEAAAYYERSRRVCQRIDDLDGVATTSLHLGILARNAGDYDRAAGLYAESLAISRQIGDTSGIATTLNNMAALAWSRERYDEAMALCMECLRLRRQLGDRRGTALALKNLGNSYHQRGDAEQALTCFGESLTIYRKLGHRGGILLCLEGFMLVAEMERQPERVAVLGCAIDTQRKALGLARAAPEQPEFDGCMASARERLDDVAWLRCQTRGSYLTLDDAVAYALGEG